MVGNDIVDLFDPDAQPRSFRPGFDERVFAAEERRAIEQDPNPLARRWAHWAAKEAAYKLARQIDETFVFSPRRLVANYDVPMPQGPDEEGPDEEQQVARIIPIEDFAANPNLQEGLLIRVDRMLFQSHVGRGAGFLGLPPSGSYLVKLPDEMLADSVVIESNSTVSVTGMVYVMTNADSVAEAWVASGHIGDGDRVLVRFAESYMELRALRVTAPPQP